MIQNLKKKFLNREQIRGAMIFDFFSPGITCDQEFRV